MRGPLSGPIALALMVSALSCTRSGFSTAGGDAAIDHHDVPRLDGSREGRADRDGGDDAAVPASAFEPVTLLPGGDVRELVLVPRRSSVLYVIGDGVRVFRSADRAQSWSECARLPGPAETISVAPGGDVYVSDGRDVYVSRDDCKRWLPTGLNQRVDAMATPSATYAVAGTDDGLWRRHTGAWTRFSSLADGKHVHVLRVDRSAQHIFAGTRTNGVTRSLDGGKTWKVINAGLGGRLSVWDIAVDPGRPRRIFIGTDAALYRSDDYGDTWRSIRSGPAYALAVDGKGLVVVSTSGGLRISFNHGTSFSGRDYRSSSWEVTRAATLRFDPEIAGRLYAGNGRGLFVATDRSWAWTELDWGRSAWAINGIAAPGASSKMVYLSSSAGLLKSTNGGQTWRVATKGFSPISRTWNVGLDPADPSVVYACGQSLMRSVDRASSFSALYTTGDVDRWYSAAVAVVGQRIYLGTGSRLVVSTDGGKTFRQRSFGTVEGRVRDILLLGSAALPTAFLATSVGLFATGDDGAHFTNAGAGLSSSDVFALAKGTDGSLYAGTADGVFSAKGIAQTWSAMGLQGQIVYDLLLHRGKLIAAAQKGVFSAVLGAATWVSLPGLENRQPISLGEGPAGELLVGARGHGLFRKR